MHGALCIHCSKLVSSYMHCFLVVGGIKTAQIWLSILCTANGNSPLAQEAGACAFRHQRL